MTCSPKSLDFENILNYNCNITGEYSNAKRYRA